LGFKKHGAYGNPAEFAQFDIRDGKQSYVSSTMGFSVH
jgi:hypothetical protein